MTDPPMLPLLVYLMWGIMMLAIGLLMEPSLWSLGVVAFSGLWVALVTYAWVVQ